MMREMRKLTKYLFGIMLVAFGTFWGGEGIGIHWPLGDLFLVVLAAFYLAVAGALILWLRPYAPAKPALAPGGDELPVEEVLG